MSSKRSVLSALVLLGALSAPAGSVEIASPQVRTSPGGGIGSFGGLTTLQQAAFAQELSLTVGGVNQLGLNPASGAPTLHLGPGAAKLEARQIVALLAAEAAKPVPGLKTQASRAVLAALWSAPEFSAALVHELEQAGTPETAKAAHDLSALIMKHRAHVDAAREDILSHVPELKRLSVPGSAEELFDGMAERKNGVETSAVAGHETLRIDPASQLSHWNASAVAPNQHELPAVERLETKTSFLKKNGRTIGAYAFVLAASASVLKGAVAFGSDLVASGPAAALPGIKISSGIALLSPVPLLLLQMGVILGVGWLFSKVLSRLGQPKVIGQVLGGLALGPSLLGAIAPAFAAALFPAASLLNLHTLSQIGLLAFMFIVGQEIDLKALKKQSGAAGLISHASIFIPFALGSALALALFTGFAPAGVPFLSFCLFMGIAMSITAFPVLARILHEKGMTNTPVGSLGLACAAIDDITGWALLALVLAVASGGSMAAVGSILGLTALFLGGMFGAVKPLLRKFADKFAGRKWYRPASLALSAALLAAASYFTEHIGIHALFGAFIAGIVMPRGVGEMTRKLAERIQGVSAAFLLPIFFALTGLRTHLDMLNSPALWGTAAAVILVATLGKLGGGAAAARFSGMKWRDSLSIGALMNTRGLMELVVLNIGYDRGIISGPLFAIFVLMAVITTMMTGPLMNLFNKTRHGAEAPPAPAHP